MIEDISHFLTANGYLPHGFCIKWSQPLVLTYVISDVLIFLSYCSMPIALMYFSRRRKDFPYPWLLVMFSLFILACGLTHLMGAILLWQPLYGLDAFFKAVTAAVSVGTAIAMWPLMPQALSLPSPSQLNLINKTLQQEIAERKRIEEALRRAKEVAEQGLAEERILRSAIVEFSDDAIVGLTLDGEITSWNQAAERMFGYDAEAIKGHSIFEFLPDQYREDEENMLVTIRRGDAIKHYETERLHQDGSRFTVSVAMSPIRDKNGRVIGASKIVRDVSERKRAEQEINRLNADLERRVVERTAELTAANRELDSFAYAVSHDLRAPLRAMNGFSQAVIEDYGENLPAEANLYLQQIGIASKKMGDLIDGLLVLSRCTRGGMRHDLIDLTAMAQRLLVDLKNGDPQRQVDVQVETGMTVSGDTRMVEILLGNLLENAWKYTARTRNATIRVYAQTRDGAPFFCVADNGAGFDMAHAGRLFQPFQRLHRQDEFPGIGIGLATVQRIVHRHGGHIEASGQPGEGAVFCFTLSDFSGSAQTADQEVL